MIYDQALFKIDSHEVTVLTLLDFSNTFNTVDFDILCDIMRSLIISPEATYWFQSCCRFATAN